MSDYWSIGDGWTWNIVPTALAALAIVSWFTLLLSLLLFFFFWVVSFPKRFLSKKKYSTNPNEFRTIEMDIPKEYVNKKKTG